LPAKYAKEREKKKEDIAPAKDAKEERRLVPANTANDRE
jgi:hypothetical protein